MRSNLNTAVTKFLGGNFRGWKGAQPAAPPAVIRPGVGAPELVEWVSFGNAPGSAGANSPTPTVLNGVAYGIDGSNLVGYDASDGTWSTVVALPAATEAFCQLTNDGTDIWMLSTKHVSVAATARGRLFRLDGPALTTWTEMARMDDGAGNGMGGVGAWVYANGHLIAASGSNFFNTLSTQVRKYSIAGDSWATMTSIPTGVQYADGVVVDDNDLHMFGGGIVTCSSLHQVYDIGGDSWSAGVALPVALTVAVQTITPGGLIVVGGGLGPTPSLTNLEFWLYNPISTVYTELPPTLNRVDVGGFVLGDEIIRALSSFGDGFSVKSVFTV